MLLFAATVVRERLRYQAYEQRLFSVDDTSAIPSSFGIDRPYRS